MVNQTEINVENGQGNGVPLLSSVGNIVVKTLMVGLGTVGFAQDEIRKIVEESGSFVQKLEERGESMSQSGRDRLKSQRESLNTKVGARQGQVKDMGAKANESLGKASGAVLTRANVPTSEDIQILSEQIELLNQKVDMLSEEQQELGDVEEAPEAV